MDFVVDHQVFTIRILLAAYLYLPSIAAPVIAAWRVALERCSVRRHPLEAELVSSSDWRHLLSF